MSHLQITVQIDYGVGWKWGFLIQQNMRDLDFTGESFSILKSKDDVPPLSNLRCKLVLFLVRALLHCRMEGWSRVRKISKISKHCRNQQPWEYPK